MPDVPNTLPPGWDCKFDPRTSRYYFINHHTKVTTWDDPRLKYRQIHGTPSHIPAEHIPLQHGSPEFRRNYVYPSQTCPQPAFQMPKSIPVQDLSNMSRIIRGSPGLTPHKSSGSAKTETTLTQVPTDTEQAVSKISTMFPTVSETHIRLLMKKYYNREAVVISALQVEKYPITTPGPYTTPPPSRNLQQTPPPAGFLRNSSPIVLSRQHTSVQDDFRNSPKPHSSPKMKLRYMKSIFPQVEETVLLEVLANNDNNVQKASEALKEMGFEKKDMKLTKTMNPKTETAEKAKVVIPPRPLTQEEKSAVKTRLQAKYQQVPERVLLLALESAEFHADRAQQILDVMLQEEARVSEDPKTAPDTSSQKLKATVLEASNNKIEESNSSELLKKSKSSVISPAPSVHALPCDKLESKARRTKERKNSVRELQQENTAPNEANYRSTFLLRASGHNSTLAKGSDNTMLLEDYVSWDGPDPRLRSGSQSLARGPDSSLLGSRCTPAGPNAALRKGPARGLAKGSLYSQLQSTTIESRGK